jgi:CxxC motif-containing protein (DUF1111 family)
LNFIEKSLQMKNSKLLIFSTLVIALAISCQKLIESPADEDSLDGMVEGLNATEQKIFLDGDVAFNNDVFTAATGLGPLFVATSCGSCHAGDGKGHPFTTLTRFGQTDSSGNLFLQAGGPQLQHRALPNFQPENLPKGATFSRFMPPANTGLGFLEFISDADILANADPNDTDKDGISGVVNWITIPNYVPIKPNSLSLNGQYIGRFGKKAAVYDLLQQTVNAYNQDMGITSNYEPFDTYSKQEIDPEVTNQTVQNVVLYLRTLKAPIQRNPTNSTILQGQTVFKNIGCESCHKANLRTSDAPIVALTNKSIKPYTDLLLHDMGDDLNDGYTEGSAKTAEWRTSPLWGLGLSKNSQGGLYFLLHDGRAKSIEAAILLHGGEGNKSRQKFKSLSEIEKQKLTQFLESL